MKGESDLLNRKISETFFGGKNIDNLIRLSSDGKTIAGKILKMPHLKHFSIKFYKALKKLSRLVEGKKGAQTAFIYSNLVVVGIDLFREILLENGYLEYQDDPTSYEITGDTICYYCGKKHKEHTRLKRQSRGEEYDIDDEEYDGSDDDGYESSDSEMDENMFREEPLTKVSETSSEYTKQEKKNLGVIKEHHFHPATFLTITGGSSDDVEAMISDTKKETLDNVFNKMDNKKGKNLKFVLGSRVMNEGISMRNVGEVHLLDVYFNLGKVDQVVGRAIRWCSHYSVMDENNKFPTVNVYKYVVALDKEGHEGLSSEEDLYRKAEQKYLLIKKIERAMKERAFDCPLNMHGNVFSEEIHKYKDCKIHKRGTNDDKVKNPCPAICDYEKCVYKCDDPQLNYEYYDPNRSIYKMIPNNNIDKSTFTDKLAQSEIDYSKRKIKEMFIVKATYKLPEIVKYVKESYSDEKKDLFDEFFVFKALDALIPKNQNDHNNFKDTIINKSNMKGYLIYRDENYIFQPFDENEDVPMYYRVNNMTNINNDLSLFNYLKNNDEYKQLKDKLGKSKQKQQAIIEKYNFDDTIDYYDKRDEYDYVGIIDKNITQSKIEGETDIDDEFKLRRKIPKNLDKQRATGLATDKGAVCATAKSKEYLYDLATKKLKIDLKGVKKRKEYCELILHDMYLKEKYSTGKDKITYLKIPANHKKYQFPLNLEDRVKHRIKLLKKNINREIDVKTKKITKKDGPEKGMPSYQLIVKKEKYMKDNKILDDMNAKEKDGSYIILLE